MKNITAKKIASNIRRALDRGMIKKRSDIIFRIQNENGTIQSEGQSHMIVRDSMGSTCIVSNIPKALIISNGGEKRTTNFQLERFDFFEGGPISKKNLPGNFCGIYALVAINNNDIVAAYVGKSKNLSKRLGEHADNIEQRWSKPLFDYASQNGLVVGVVFLEATSIDECDMHEFMWTQAALKADLYLPNHESWAVRLNTTSTESTRSWPSNKWILEKSLPVRNYSSFR